ncbi:MAG: ribonuclease HII [Microgenomates group bacterium Gr01-1014_16]|nr:MAG: ribonuclease HII [Microgenomates group bacterium Gr01-1014_16]
MGWANKQIFKKLIRRIEADKYIVDGNLKISVQRLASSVQSVIKADTKIPEVMAASIVAKVVRDQHMKKLHDEYVMYGWKSNKGYGTKYHINAIREHGMSRYHRSVFVTTALKERLVTSV